PEAEPPVVVPEVVALFPPQPTARASPTPHSQRNRIAPPGSSAERIRTSEGEAQGGGGDPKIRRLGRALLQRGRGPQLAHAELEAAGVDAQRGGGRQAGNGGGRPGRAVGQRGHPRFKEQPRRLGEAHGERGGGVGEAAGGKGADE